ncbi:hypothetical protein HWV62_23484 [Athelia sp. TMB]|nr:hypothetical protein HWV62_23484 [Athelia sp. TMB]
MAQHQLEVSILLGLAALGSAFTFIVFRAKDSEGAIKLPTGDDSLEREHDPFDIAIHEDLVDGHPIDEERFWRKARVWKLALSTTIALALVIDTIGLTFAITSNVKTSARTLAACILRILFALYTLVFSMHAINLDAIGPHSSAMWHLSMLTFISTAALFSMSILPAPHPLAPAVASPGASAATALTWTTTALYLVSTLLASTLPHGPDLNYNPINIYTPATILGTTHASASNVCGIATASVLSYLTFSYTTCVVMLGHQALSLEIGDLPILPANMRATGAYASMRRALLRASQNKGNGWALGRTLVRLNAPDFITLILLACVVAVLFYAPAFFLQKLVQYVEDDPMREDRRWGWVFVVGLLVVNATGHLISGQLWSLATTTLQVRIKMQLNSVLYGKTLVRKDVASSARAEVEKDADNKDKKPNLEVDADDDDDDNEDAFSSKAQIMTLMTTDVDHVADFAWHAFTLIDSPVELLVGTLFLYHLLGSSSLWGLLVTVLFLPLNHLAGKIVEHAQDMLMKRRDERVALMNEVLGGIRMVKFMGWERKVEARVLGVRKEELKYQRRNFLVETGWNALWDGSPILVTLVAFWHFTVVRGEELTPAIAFTSITIFSELKFALNALPETFINMLQSLVSLRRIEKYLDAIEISPVPADQPTKIMFRSATVTWAQDRSPSSHAYSASSTCPSTPTNPEASTSSSLFTSVSGAGKFILTDVTASFPQGELSLVCGRLGSGKTLLLMALLGEADLLAGQIVAPRSSPDFLATRGKQVKAGEEWVLPGVCGYVPQVAWLTNASIKDNVLFNLPLDEGRYQKTLEVCALNKDLEILEDGDQSEIGERGVNLSGGQKARVSLARAVYSRASTLFLDDVLSAVDAHTAQQLYHECLKGPLMRGRTIVLVSHHVQLCAPGASYVVALDNGRTQFVGSGAEFCASGIMDTLVQSGRADSGENDVEGVVENELAASGSGNQSQSSTLENTQQQPKKEPRKLVEEEARAIGHVNRDIWKTYILACGGAWFWAVFFVILAIAAMSPVAENWWLKYWAGAATERVDEKGPKYYIGVYALVSRGRLLNRFGKDFEGIDSSMSDDFAHTITYSLSAATSFIIISVVNGPGFVLVALIFGSLYYRTAKLYSQTSRDMRRLDSVTRSPLYSIYGETIAGVTVLRAFGASSKYLRDMLTCVDMVRDTRLVAVASPAVNASLAGFALAFASSFTMDIETVVRRFVGLEQSMVAVERVKEYTELVREPPEFIEPRPAPSWPQNGAIKCENLIIRYACGILGRTGSGKSTLALSLFRFVEATEGRILVDDLDISKIGLTDLRTKLTIIPQDPTILSGTLRSTLDVFEEYQDAEIYEALRRVHLIPVEGTPEEAPGAINANVFRNLDSPVSEGGDNFSTGEKQLLCMARAILKHSKVLVMDELWRIPRCSPLAWQATASVDYATDELIGKTIRREFADSTILTIAHRLRTVIDYDRVMVLDQGRIVEFDNFYGLCKASGHNEFSMLKKMAGL